MKYKQLVLSMWINFVYKLKPPSSSSLFSSSSSIYFVVGPQNLNCIIFFLSIKCICDSMKICAVWVKNFAHNIFKWLSRFFKVGEQIGGKPCEPHSIVGYFSVWSKIKVFVTEWLGYWPLTCKHLVFENVGSIPTRDWPLNHSIDCVDMTAVSYNDPDTTVTIRIPILLIIPPPSCSPT